MRLGYRLTENGKRLTACGFRALCLLLAAFCLLAGSTAYAACTNPAGTEGEIIYNDDQNVPQICSGADWIALGVLNPAAGGAGCSNPTGTEGEIIYNAVVHKPQYCDGDDWIEMIGGTVAGSCDVTCPAASAGADVTSGLIHRWTFDENTGTNAANAVGAQAGTLTNGATWAPGIYGSAVDLDGSNDYVALGTMDVSGAASSIFLWLRADALTGNDIRFLAKANGSGEANHWWMLSTVDGILARARLKTGGTTNTVAGNFASPKQLTTEKWQHIGFTYDGTNFKVYLDGVEVGNLPKTGALSTDNTVAAAIGRNGSDTAGGYFNGKIDDVRIYNRALTATEVEDLYDHGITTLCGG